MSNVTTSQVLLEGVRHVVLKLTGVLDTSNVAYGIIVDPANLTPMETDGIIKPAGVRLEHIEFTIQDGLAVYLYWDTDGTEANAKLIYALEGRGHLPAERHGSIKNNATSPNGKVGLSTKNWAALVAYSLTLTFIKVATLP